MIKISGQFKSFNATKFVFCETAMSNRYYYFKSGKEGF